MPYSTYLPLFASGIVGGLQCSKLFYYICLEVSQRGGANIAFWFVSRLYSLLTNGITLLQYFFAFSVFWHSFKLAATIESRMNVLECPLYFCFADHETFLAVCIRTKLATPCSFPIRCWKCTGCSFGTRRIRYPTHSISNAFDKCMRHPTRWVSNASSTQCVGRVECPTR